jgi:hypothetical protein
LKDLRFLNIGELLTLRLLISVVIVYCTLTFLH